MCSSGLHIDCRSWKTNSYWVQVELLANSYWVQVKLLINSHWVQVELLTNSHWEQVELLTNSYWVQVELLTNSYWVQVELFTNSCWVQVGLLIHQTQTGNFHVQGIFVNCASGWSSKVKGPRFHHATHLCPLIHHPCKFQSKLFVHSGDTEQKVISGSRLLCQGQRSHHHDSITRLTYVP
jgi:hypothetical protein